MGKRKNESISPIEKAVNIQTKKTKNSAKKKTKAKETSICEMASNTQNASTSQTTPSTPAGTTPQTPQQVLFPHPFPYSPYVMNANSPTFSQQTQSMANPDSIQTIIQKLERIDSKLGQLDKIQSTVDQITTRLNTMETKISEIEHSQQFISTQYESMSNTTDLNKQSINKLNSSVDKLIVENKDLKSMNESMADDILDLKCRSMRDNMLFFGIPEGAGTFVPTVQFNQVRATNAVPPESTISDSQSEPEVLSGSVPEPHLSQTGSVESCESKVHTFLSKILNITNSTRNVCIDRAHRVGPFRANKTRPIVVKFKDTDSKIQVKDALKTVKLRDTPYNVSDQYPPEVQQRRKELIPHMIQARRVGKRAFLYATQTRISQ
ncbi:hypothetical protein ACF0H5_004681 [Mactra antiquata]